MKFVTRPPIDANGVGHGGDDLDEALFAFFRSEMPRPWPQLKLPDGPPARPPVRPAEPAPAPSRRSWFRSPRFALAASVALLIGGYAVMSTALTPPEKPNNPSLKDDSASPKRNIDDVRGKEPAEDDVDFHGWLEQDGNKPTTIHIEVYKNK
jgi:hypothetical protein